MVFGLFLKSYELILSQTARSSLSASGINVLEFELTELCIFLA